MNATVRDVMTPTVITVKEDTPFEAIAAALREHRVSAFPVLDEASRVIGVVSESDLLAKLALGMQDDAVVPGMITGILRRQQLLKAHAVTAAELMTSPAYTAAPGDSVEQAARIMYLRNVKRLPVVDSGGCLAGIVSRADVLAVYSRTDADIAEEIRTGILACETPANPATPGVSVTAGVATIAGRPQTRQQGHAIIGRARHVQGVVAVRDRLDYPAPGPDPFDVLARSSLDLGGRLPGELRGGLQQAGLQVLGQRLAEDVGEVAAVEEHEHIADDRLALLRPADEVVHVDYLHLAAGVARSDDGRRVREDRLGRRQVALGRVRAVLR